MKKLIAIVLALVMALAMTSVAFADGEGEVDVTQRPTSGTIDNVKGTITVDNITINGDAPVATYAVYQILKLKSFDFSTGSYDYEYTDDAWKTFFTTGAGKDYLETNDKGLLVWKGESSAERVAEFAKLALAYAQHPDNTITPTTTTFTPSNETNKYTVVPGTDGKGSVIFEDLQLGYYLVDSSVGALCGLSTTNPDGYIASKNGAPTLEKQVQEDLSGQWGKTNSADIGQDVNFRITVHVHDGAQNYAIYDVMEAGLTFKPGTVEVVVIDGVTEENTVYPATQEKVVDGSTVTVQNYVLTYDADFHSFTIAFTETFCNTLNTNDRLIVHYSAMLNRFAEIGNGSAEDPANQNTAHMHYGDGHETASDSTTTKTYAFDLVKTNGQNQLLGGAQFEIYDAATGGIKITMTKIDDETYRRNAASGEGETITEIIVTGGKVRVEGLDNGTYWLEETKEPEGYKKLTSRQKFTIADGNLDAIINGNIVSTNSGVQVVNHTGTMLPETGGIGTLLFTALGGTTALGAGVVLVTKKRMSKIKDED